MKLIVDAMGGDHAPEQIVLGAVAGLEKNPALELIFTGEETAIRAVLSREGVKTDRIRIVPCASEIRMEDDPLCILKSKKDSSMAEGLRLLRDGEGDAFLSAGSTGALLVGASSRIYKLKLPGIRRCAIGTVLPLSNPTLLLDSGANIEVNAEELVQFAHMGSAYMQGVFHLEEPRVGLVNNGAEQTKGTALYVQTHALLKNEEEIRFVGNVEARDIPLNGADVLVCDGFVGNVILKLSEGFGKFIGQELRGLLSSGPSSLLAALLIRRKLGKFKERLSYEKYGGAPLLGTCRPVIKAHGSSRAAAITSAVEQAMKFSSSHVTERIRAVGEREEKGEK